MIKTSVSETESGTLFSVKAISKALATSIIFTLLLLAVFSVVITYSPVSEASSDIMVKCATYTAASLCGFLSSKKANSKGWIRGMTGGLAYIFTVILLGISVSPNFAFETKTVLEIIICAIAGAFGGIVGINLGK